MTCGIYAGLEYHESNIAARSQPFSTVLSLHEGDETDDEGCSCPWHYALVLGILSPLVVALENPTL
jgi:hypothetical protein